MHGQNQALCQLKPRGQTSVKTENPDRLMTSPQLAEIMGVSLVTLSRWRSAEKGPPFIRLGPTSVRYSVSAYQEWLVNQAG